MKNLLSILKMDFVKTNLIGKNLRSFSCLLSCLILVFGSSFQSLAVVSSSSNAFAVASGSNADPYGVMTLDLYEGDYSTSLLSSLGTVTNSVTGDVIFGYSYFNTLTETYHGVVIDPEFYDGRFHFSVILPSDCVLTSIWPRLTKSALPSPGSYSLGFDFASDFSYDVNEFFLYCVTDPKNVSTSTVRLYPDFDTFSGDIYFNSYNFNLSNLSYMELISNISPSEGVIQIGGSFSVRFTKIDSDSSAPSTGPDYSSEDYESDVSGSLSDISSSIGDMSESLDSAAENLEYISTSQNLIIQGIDNVIMHISDQLYAFWDQLYNLIHEPTYAKLEEILAALRAIANNSDIYAVVEQVKESSEKQTADITANDNANTAKVEAAVEKHGNFIIEGLKSLFIPSDEYFKSYFDDLYQYFSDRFGFLSFPIDLLIRLIDLFVNSANSDCILTLPEFEISGEQLITEASFNLTDFLENDFALLLSSIRMVTSIGLIMAFVHLCQDKWNEVMRN